MKATKENGLWVLPSRRRPESLARFFEAYEKTEASTEVYVLLDKEDFLGNLPIKPKNVTYYDLPQEAVGSQGDKLKWFWKNFKLPEWVGWLNDDDVPITKHWDTLTIANLNGSNFVTGNDEWQPHRFVGARAFSRRLLDCFGGFYPNDFRHSFVDDMFETVGKETGCWTKCPEIIVHHRHYRKGEAVCDSTYRQNESYFQHDLREWNKWLKDDFLNVVKNVQKLQEEIQNERSNGPQASSPAG